MNESWLILKESGLPAATFTSIISVDVKDNNKTLQYPTEKGSFASYNKVSMPLELSLTAAFEGSDAETGNLIDTLFSLAKGVELVSLTTPETEYQNLAVENVNYSRKRENGVGVVYFDITLKEVRQVEPAYAKAIKKPKNPEAAPTADVGKKQLNSVIVDIKKSITGA